MKRPTWKQVMQELDGMFCKGSIFLHAGQCAQLDVLQLLSSEFGQR